MDWAHYLQDGVAWFGRELKVCSKVGFTDFTPLMQLWRNSRPRIRDFPPTRSGTFMSFQVDAYYIEPWERAFLQDLYRPSLPEERPDQRGRSWLCIGLLG